MNDVGKAGTQFPADASILWGNEMDAYKNRIPIHYIKGHTFWGGCCQSICTASPTASPIRLDILSIVH